VALAAHRDILDEILAMSDVPFGGGFSPLRLSRCLDVDNEENSDYARDCDDDW
jgi:hypothetical protein